MVIQKNIYVFYVLLSFSLLFTSCDDDNPVSDTGPEQKAFDTFLESDISIDTSYVSPLTAELSFTTKEPVKVSVTVMGEKPISHSFDQAATQHDVPVLGLYPDKKNNVKIRVENADSDYGMDTLEVQTDPLPDYFADVTVTKADTSNMEPGLTLSNFSLGDAGTFRTKPFMFDENGDIRWMLDMGHTNDMAWMVRRSNDGNVWLFDSDHIYKYDMLGNQLNKISLTNTKFSTHHELIQLPDGNLIIAVNNDNIDTIEDHIIELDPSSGSIVNTWDMRDILDVDRHTYHGEDRDWLHMNAIFYDEEDKSLIISGRNQGVFEVTMDNKLKWILAPHKGWGKAGVDSSGHVTSDFLLTALNSNGNPYSNDVQLGDRHTSNFDWTWGQHAPLLLPNGNLFVFDNGLKRNYGNASSYSRGVVYSINEEDTTVKQVWQYGKDRGFNYYSSIISDVDYLPKTGNRLIMPGIVRAHDPPHAYVTEVDPSTKEVIFEAEIDLKNRLSTGSGWGQIDIVYRSERLKLYPPQKY